MAIALVGLFATTLLGMTQTNTVSETTNSVPKSPGEIREEKLAAVKKAMPAYFTLEADEHGVRTISTTFNDTIRQDEDGYAKIGIICYIFPPEKIPETIDFQLITKDEAWNFTKGLDYPIDADGKPVNPTKQSIMGNPDEVEHDHLMPMIESLNEEVTLDQFKQLAWSKHVWFKTNKGFIEVAAPARQKWKLMWNYFNLLQTNISNTLSNNEIEN